MTVCRRIYALHSGENAGTQPQSERQYWESLVPLGRPLSLPTQAALTIGSWRIAAAGFVGVSHARFCRV